MTFLYMHMSTCPKLFQSRRKGMKIGAVKAVLTVSSLQSSHLGGVPVADYLDYTKSCGKAHFNKECDYTPSTLDCIK